ncbi:unnamed protein product, partial [Allacma fusca]
MDEFGCPRCKTTKLSSPNLKLMVNTCGHSLCAGCIELLFIKGAAACPDCGVVLRRNNFRVQLFEDVQVEKDVDIRRRVLKDFNKREADFRSLREYNDYLEEVEEIIFNLANGIDYLETNKKIEQYKKDNREQISKGKSRASEDILELEAIIEEEKLRTEQYQRRSMILEKEEKLRKIKNREALIDDLMFSDTDAKSIVALHKTEANDARDLDLDFDMGKSVDGTSTAASSVFQVPGHFSTGIQIGRQATTSFLPVPKVEEVPLFHYEEHHINFSGPPIPSLDSLTRSNHKYLTFVKAATVSERAGGFHSKIACRRALQDAFQDISLKPSFCG